MERWFRRESPVSRTSNTCVADHEIDDVISMSCGIQPSQRDPPWRSISEYMCHKPKDAKCVVCGLPTTRIMTLTYGPPIIPVYVEGIDMTAEQTFNTRIDGCNVKYDMTGAIYYGAHHFTARYIDEHRNVWYNDGIVHGRQCVLEGKVNNIDMKGLPSGQACTLYVYSRRQTN